jgi:hypothetical protein
MYAREGLVYWILDKQGNKAGLPIKASTLYGKPTLKNLEEKFKLNATLRKPFKADLIKAIEQLLTKPQTIRSFQQELKKQGIHVILRQNEEGRIYGVTFIDQKNKAVFNGSDLDKAYSANQLAAQLLPDPKPTISNEQQAYEPQNTSSQSSDELLNILFSPEQEDIAALNKFKRKKRKGLNL